jgi:hypothetical protein
MKAVANAPVSIGDGFLFLFATKQQILGFCLELTVPDVDFCVL